MLPLPDNMSDSLRHMKQKAYRVAVFVFSVVLCVGAILSFQHLKVLESAQEKERNDASLLITEEIQSTIKYCISATSTLATIIESSGVPQEFPTIAQSIMNQGYVIDAVEILDSGTITHVYPSEGNESVIGYNILEDEKVAKEAQIAIERKALYFAGPFELKQGGKAIIGRLPMFRNETFIGFVAILIRVESLFEQIGLSKLQPEYLIQLEKTNPQTGIEEHFIPDTKIDNNYPFHESLIEEGDWKLQIQNKNPIDWTDLIWTMVLTLLLSLLSGFLTLRLRLEPYRLQKQVDEKVNQLLKEQEKFKMIFEQRNAILESLGAAFFSLDDDLNITYWNSQAEKLLKQPREKVLGKNMLEIFGNLITPGVLDGYQNGATLLEPLQFRQHIPRLGKWFEVGVYPFPSGSAVFFTDITESIRHLKDIEERNEKLNEIAWIQSHLVRAPLARLMGIVHVLEQENMDQESKVRLNNELLKAAHELDSILHDIVDKANTLMMDEQSSIQD